MRPQHTAREVLVAELAARQHGVVAHSQLIALGFSRPGVQRRLRAGRLHSLHRGVYSVGHRLLSMNGRWMAAVLSCGDDALLSHRTAAALWQMLPSTGGQIDVTASTRRRRPGVVVHEGHHDDRTVVEGIPVTTVARTLLDLAEAAPARLERALEAAERMGFFDLRKVESLMDRNPGRRGSRVLEAALDSYRDPSLTRSELERRFLRLCRRAGLPAPATNIWIAGQEVDAVWCGKRLAVELDSHEFHRTRAAFERDRVRDGDLQLAGYRVLRVTHRRLRDEPRVVVSMVRSLLAAAPS